MPRYVALNTLNKVVSMDTNAVQRHRNTILDCLRDGDISIRRRALELSYALVNESNVRVMTRELLSFLEVADNEFKLGMTTQICLGAERFAPDKRWQIDTVLRVLKLVSSPLRRQFGRLKLTIGWKLCPRRDFICLYPAGMPHPGTSVLYRFPALLCSFGRLVPRLLDFGFYLGYWRIRRCSASGRNNRRRRGDQASDGVGPRRPVRACSQLPVRQRPHPAIRLGCHVQAFCTSRREPECWNLDTARPSCRHPRYFQFEFGS